MAEQVMIAPGAPAATSAPEEDLETTMQAIKAKQAAALIAVREKYEKEIQAQENDFQKRWDDLIKGVYPDSKDSKGGDPTALVKTWTSHELKTRPGEHAIGFHLSSSQLSAYRHVFQEFKKTVIPLVLNKPDARTDKHPLVLKKAKSVFVEPIISVKDQLDRQQALEAGDKLMQADEKFTFLGNLFSRLKNVPLQILIVAEDPDIRKSIEVLCFARAVSGMLQNDMTSLRPGLVSNSPLKVAIASTRMEGQAFTKPANIVIAFDESFDPSAEHVVNARRNWYGAPGEAPVLRLFYFNTYEQLAFIFAPNPTHRTESELKTLLKYSFTNLIAGGMLDAYQTGADKLANKIADWVTSSAGKPKVTPAAYLPVVPEMKIMTAGTDAAEGVSGQTMASAAVSPRDGFDAGSESEAGRKRKRALEEAESSKRPRQDVKTMPVNAGGIEEVFDEKYDYDALTKDELILRLRTLQKRHSEHLQSFGIATKLHQESRDAVKPLRDKLEEQANAIERNKDTISRLRGQLDNIKAERSELNRRVKELQDAIEKGESSETVKSWKRLQVENNTLRDQVSKRDERLKQRESDLEFFRAQYQSATSSTAEMNNELESLREELAIAKQKAEGKANELRQMTFENERKDFQAEIRGLKGELVMRERRVRALEKKLEAALGN